MRIFELLNQTVFPYESRDKNVFYLAENFKARLIELGPGESIPTCDMASNVIFVVMEGDGEVTVNDKTEKISRGYCMISPPATVSLRSENGVRIVGFQIESV